MNENPKCMLTLFNDLANPAWTLAALCALFESGLVEHLREPRTPEELAEKVPTMTRDRIVTCLGVAATAGVIVKEGARYHLADFAIPFSQPPMRVSYQAQLRTVLMQTLALTDAAAGRGPKSGWGHTDAALLQAQGDASTGFAGAFKANIVGALGDLAARLDRPGARFLDVGVGVGALAIAMCRMWPALSVVGLDVYDRALGIAKDNVARAELGSRIELRKLAVTELTDEAAYDVAWLPSFFIGKEHLDAAVARVRESLKPGGWILFAGSVAGRTDRERAVSALIVDSWGGTDLAVPEIEALLSRTGLTEVRALPAPSWAPILVVGRA